ncbi:MAG TPA: response regulator [Acidobacteriota bacterium]|jgi:two-component system cell cycle response regulator
MPARILVIEDNPTNLDLMVYLLRAFGHTPLVAHDGEQGLEVVRREAPDLIVCDVHMPNVDGYEVVRRLKAHPAMNQIPVIAVTALAMVGDRDKILEAGFDGYIAKPIAPDTFVGQVEAFLPPDHRALPREIAARSPAEASSPPAHRATILVVDDSPVNRDLIRSTLEPFGYKVILAHTVQEGLELARSSPPDLILSDLHMPHEDGITFIKIVRTEPALNPIPFVFISASVFGDRDRRLALEEGATRFITRPIEPQALLQEIEKCLGSRGAGERGSGGADEWGSRGEEERGGSGAEEQRSREEEKE